MDSQFTPKDLLFTVKRSLVCCLYFVFLVGVGLGGAVSWLQRCLDRTADDREEDGKSYAIK